MKFGITSWREKSSYLIKKTRRHRFAKATDAHSNANFYRALQNNNIMNILLLSTVLCGIFFTFPGFALKSETFYQNIAKMIHMKTKAGVHMKGSFRYHQARKIQNGACSSIYPDLITVPKSSKDISAIISIATQFDIPVSVKSGGHSYTCQGIKPGKTRFLK